MKTLCTLSLVLMWVSTVTPQPKKEVKKSTSEVSSSSKPTAGKIWGVTFVEYSYIARDQDSSIQSKNAFEFRRMYFGYDQDISDQFSARVLMQANNTETTTSGAMVFFTRQAYLEWKNLLPLANIFIGLSPTPSFANSEKIWGYRSLEKVILDRTGLAASNDIGIGVRGKIVQDGTLGYALMVGNGNGGKIENDKYKRIYGEFDFEPSKGTLVEIYGDFENGTNAQSKLTGKGLFGYESAAVTFGAEGFYRNVHHGKFQTGVTSPDSNLVGASANISFQIIENIRLVLRGDFFDADFLEKNSGLQEVFAVAGLDFVPTKNVHLIPNALYTHRLYKKKLSADPALIDNVTVRLTFAYSFSA